MVAMAAFGAVAAGLFATGPTLAQERAGGWLRQLRTTPMPPRTAVVAKVAVAMAWTLPSIALVAAMGFVVDAVDLGWAQWVGHRPRNLQCRCRHDRDEHGVCRAVASRRNLHAPRLDARRRCRVQPNPSLQQPDRGRLERCPWGLAPSTGRCAAGCVDGRRWRARRDRVAKGRPHPGMSRAR